MDAKKEHKRKAIALRKQGKSYTEILEAVPVAKSTLSLWLRDVGMSARQQQQLTAKKRAAQRRGGEARRQQRVTNTEQIFRAAAAEIGSLNARELLLVGTALYWAEGSKEHETTIGQSIDFGNTDASMLKMFLRFLFECLGVRREDVRFSLYIHESSAERTEEVRQYWQRELALDNLAFHYVYYKQHNPKTVRINRHDRYFGTLRIRVPRSSHLQRKISGYTYGITGATWRIV